MSATQKPLILVDGSSYLFRAYHALPPLNNSKGQPTGAIYGVINMLRKLRKDYDPIYFAVVFDPKGKTFRHDLYEDYKANRTVMPDELQGQIQPLFELIKAMGLPLIIVDGMEADDVIGTLTQHALQENRPVLISTGDKDLAQLVNDKVTLINTMSGTLLDPPGVLEKFGVKPSQIVDYLTLVGDTVDNLPGIPKVGPKTAVKWLSDYGNLAGVIAQADKIPGKIGENLRATLDKIPLYKELVTIKCDVPYEFDLENLKPKAPDQAKLIEIFKELEFKSLLSEALNATSAEIPVISRETIEKDHQLILTEAEFLAWVTRLEQTEIFAFDTETTSLDDMIAELVGVSFAINIGEAAYVPFGHHYMGAPAQLKKAFVLEYLKPILENPNIKKIGQNLKYDMKVLANDDITLRGVAYDTMLESYVLDSSSRHDMGTLALKYLGQQTIAFTDIAGKGAKQLTFNQIALEEAAPYAAEDADITLQLQATLWPRIACEPGLSFVFNQIELPLLPILAKLERTGVLIDKQLLQAQSTVLAKEINKLEQQVYLLADSVFNLSSPKQLQEILFEKMGLPVLEKTPTGQPSTAESVLSELAHDYELPALILKHRSLSKLKSTYTDKLPLQINSNTGRVHTSYNQTGAGTGRLSSSDPNLQNIPIRSEEGRQIRQAFIAPPGYKIVALDYSQIELRIMAHISGDEGLIKAFASGQDIHRATAAEVFGIPLDEVSDNQRRSAKAINFGLIYGMSAFGLAKQLGVDRKEAQAYVDLYFQRYPGVKAYMEAIRVQAHERGYVETIYGRRLYLPEISSRNKQRVQASERAAINAPMQGTAADIIKLAMIRVDHWLNESKVDVRMIMQVHDELVFEVAEKDLERALEHIENAMTEVKELNVPIYVETGIGDNWDEAH